MVYAYLAAALTSGSVRKKLGLKKSGGGNDPNATVDPNNPDNNPDIAKFNNDQQVRTNSFDSADVNGRMWQDTGNTAVDKLNAQIGDQLVAARARYNRLGTRSGATQQDLQAAVNPLAQQLAIADGQQNALSGLTQQLTSSAIGSTAGASMAAIQAARMSGDGRYGSGGMAAMAASRGAVDAAVGQSAALSNALIQGRMAEANYQQNWLQNRGGIAAALSTLLQQQAGLKEQRGQLGVAMEQQFADTLAQSQSVYGDLQIGTKRGWKDKAPGIFGLI